MVNLDAFRDLLLPQLLGDVQRLLLSPAEVSHVAGTIVVRAVRVVVPLVAVTVSE